MDFGVWTENSRGTYNKWDGVARSTTQVCPSNNLDPNCFCVNQLVTQFLHWKATRDMIDNVKKGIQDQFYVKVN